MMKVNNVIWILLMCVVLISCKKSKYDSDYFDIDVNGEKRTYLLHKPNNFDTQSEKSLIIAFHGGTGSPKNIEDQSQLSVLSDSEGFLVCYPEGYKRTWNAGGCCGKAAKKNIDDIAFISALIDELISTYGVDSKRVYLTGMSNGGFMSYKLACEIPTKIAAIAPVAATMSVSTCVPSNAVSIIHFHSVLDENVPYSGGIGNGISDHYNPPVDSIFSVWNSINNCTTPNIEVYAGTDYSLFSWTNCSDSTEMNLYVTKDGGHSWPMGTKPRKKADEPSQYLNASQLMWNFFKNHPKP